MSTLIIAVLSFVGFIAAYHTYGKWLARKIFGLNPDQKVPSQELRDDVDYVPTKKEVIFGHHFTSIAGTGPIVGPAIAVFWGWLPALLWVVIGSIFIGAVHDFGALVVSLRNRGQTVGDIAGRMITPRGKAPIPNHLIHGIVRGFGHFRSGHSHYLRSLPGIGAVGVDRDSARGGHRRLDIPTGREHLDTVHHCARDNVYRHGRGRLPVPDRPLGMARHPATRSDIYECGGHLDTNSVCLLLYCVRPSGLDVAPTARFHQQPRASFGVSAARFGACRCRTNGQRGPILSRACCRGRHPARCASDLALPFHHDCMRRD